jgi:hypothetical protein
VELLSGPSLVHAHAAESDVSGESFIRWSPGLRCGVASIVHVAAHTPQTQRRPAKVLHIRISSAESQCGQGTEAVRVSSTVIRVLAYRAVAEPSVM